MSEMPLMKVLGGKDITMTVRNRKRQYWKNLVMRIKEPKE